MEELLGGLNKHLIEVLHELNTTYRDDVQKLQSIPKSPDEIPPQIQGLKETVEHLSELELLLKPPLHTVIDGIFGGFFLSTRILDLLLRISQHSPSARLSQQQSRTRSLTS